MKVILELKALSQIAWREIYRWFHIVFFLKSRRLIPLNGYQQFLLLFSILAFQPTAVRTRGFENFLHSHYVWRIVTNGIHAINSYQLAMCVCVCVCVCVKYLVLHIT